MCQYLLVECANGCDGLVLHVMAEVKCKATWAFTKPTKKMCGAPPVLAMQQAMGLSHLFLFFFKEEKLCVLC